VVASQQTSPKRLRRSLVALVMATAFGAAGCGGDGPASFVGRTSNAVVYVTWTRSGDALSGQLTQALRDDVDDGTVDTVRTSFDGTADGSTVALRLNQGLGSISTLTGELDGDELALDYPGVNGGVVTIPLREGDGEDFNAALADLRDEAQQDKLATDEAAAEQQAIERAATAADAVQAAIEALGQSAENATASNPDLYRADLDTIRSSLDTVKASYQVVQQAEANDFDTVCDDAAIVGDDVQIMQEDIAAMHADVRSNTDPAVLDDEVRELRLLLADMEAVDPALLPAGAPTRAQVEDAIRAARRAIRLSGGVGADLTAVEDLLDQAQAIKDKADAACQRAGG
jgi:hypothetical protein